MPAAQSTLRVRHLLVRSSHPTAQVLEEVRSIARAVDPGVVVGETVSLSEEVARETAPWRFAMRVLVAGGMMAALLASVGLVSLVSVVAALQRRERSNPAEILRD